MFSRSICTAKVFTRSFVRSSRILNSSPVTSTATTATTAINEEVGVSLEKKASTTHGQLANQKEEIEVNQEEEEESEDFFERIHNDAAKLNSIDELNLDKQLYEVLTGKTTSRLTEKLVQNKELVQELKSFVEEYTVDLHRHRQREEGNSSKSKIFGNKEFPRLENSSPDEPYTPQELFLRNSHALKTFQNLGADIKNVYFPHKDIFHPKKASSLSIAKLLAAGAHLGHSKSLYRSSNQQFIYGEYKGIHIIDLEKTLSYLKRAAKIVEGVAQNGGLILFVGTREGQQRSLEVAANRCGGYYVSSKWVPGTLTNSTEISIWERQEVDFGDRPTQRELTPSETRNIIKPDLIVILNPTENRVLLNEAMQTRVPTIGIIDTDSEASLVTYPIPANDDSIRSTALITGVLSKAGELGYKTRLREFESYKALQNQNSPDVGTGNTENETVN